MDDVHVNPEQWEVHERLLLAWDIPSDKGIIECSQCGLPFVVGELFEKVMQFQWPAGRLSRCFHCRCPESIELDVAIRELESGRPITQITPLWPIVWQRQWWI